eukprot:4505179-Lingulodinium_polyedra.AAC.1
MAPKGPLTSFQEEGGVLLDSHHSSLSLGSPRCLPLSGSATATQTSLHHWNRGAMAGLQEGSPQRSKERLLDLPPALEAAAARKAVWSWANSRGATPYTAAP